MMTNKEIQVLVVEDDDAIREGLIDLLNLEGFSIKESKNGAEALSVLQNSEPDIVLSDIMMPVMDGHTLLQNYRAIPGSKEIPFVFLSALSDKTDVRKGMNLGADDYLTKPYSREELLRVIHNQYKKYSDRKHAMHQQALTQLDAENRLNSKEKETLVKEMHHRVKHNLAVISAFFELGEMSGNPDYAVQVKDRIKTMATIHEHAYSNEFICLIDARRLIENILGNLFNKDDFNFKQNLEKFDIDINTAIPLGLLIYEFLSLVIDDMQNFNEPNVEITSYTINNTAYIEFLFQRNVFVDIDDVSKSSEIMMLHNFISQIKGSYFYKYNKNGTKYTIAYPI